MSSRRPGVQSHALAPDRSDAVGDENSAESASMRLRATRGSWPARNRTRNRPQPRARVGPRALPPCLPESAPIAPIASFGPMRRARDCHRGAAMAHAMPLPAARPMIRGGQLTSCAARVACYRRTVRQPWGDGARPLPSAVASRSHALSGRARLDAQEHLWVPRKTADAQAWWGYRRTR